MTCDAVWKTSCSGRSMWKLQGTIKPVLQQVAEMVKSKENIFRVYIAVEPELAVRSSIGAAPYSARIGPQPDCFGWFSQR